MRRNRPTPAAGELETIRQQLMRLREQKETAGYRAADVLFDTRERFGPKIAYQVALDAGISKGTAGQIIWTGKYFPADHAVRNVPGLLYTHLRCLAGIKDPVEQLAWAERVPLENLSTTGLRLAIRESKGLPAKPLQRCTVCEGAIPDGQFLAHFRFPGVGDQYLCREREECFEEFAAARRLLNQTAVQRIMRMIGARVPAISRR